MKKRMLALLLAAAVSVGLCGAAMADSAEALTYEDTIAWDGEYDVVVAGFGAAGATAAIAAADAGARVLVVEKAPEGEEGGNSRFCGQLFVYGAENEEATLAYYKQLTAGHDVPDAMLEVYTRQIAHMYDFVEKLTGIDQANYKNWTGEGFIGKMSPEYPEFEGAEFISLNTVRETSGGGYLWQTLRGQVIDRADSVDVWFESPATHLIQDPATRTILGVQVERGGRTLNIRAKNGVVLATGGFENSPEMVETYLGMPNSTYLGGAYNTGDGIRMAMEVGADLWHMDVYEGGGMLFGNAAYMGKPGERASQVKGTAFTNGSVMLLGADGSRFLREDEFARHGHLYENGTWQNPRYSTHTYIFYDDAQAADIAAAVPEEHQGDIIAADTLEELAAKTGMDAAILQRTVEKFNSYAAGGDDLEFGRDPATMSAISDAGPYYAIEIMPAITNTQGGPRRNENAEVLGHDGSPIPHLYSAGELGGITAYQYQGGGNMAECMIFGTIAGENAAAVKSDYEPVPLTRATSSMTYMPGVESDTRAAAESPDVTLSDGEYLGVSPSGMGGSVYVKVTMDGDRISKVEVLDNHETDGIGTKAIEALPGAIVEANSTAVDSISGATITSRAILEAVEDALSQVQ